MSVKILKNMMRASCLFAALGLTLPMMSCSDDSISPFSALTGKKKKIEGGGGKKGKGGGAGGEEGGAEGEDGELSDGGTSGKYTKTIDNSGANFQVKDVNLLKSSIVSCMGGDEMIKVTPEMLLPTDLNAPQTALPDAKIRFLLPTAFQAGDDVVLKLRGDLVDPEKAARTSTAADGITDTYLRAIETIGNVVAHNCAADKEECQCDDQDKARKMLSRCMPGLDPETKEFDAAAERVKDICDGPAGMRKAVASMLSSYAFASAR